MPYSVVSWNGDAYEGVSISDRKQGTTTNISCFIYISLNIRSRMFTGKIPTVMSCSTCSIASSFTSCFSGVRVSYSLVFCVVFCRSLFFLFWPLYCLSFCVMFCISLFDLFLLTIVLSVLLCNVLQIIVCSLSFDHCIVSPSV